MQATERNSWRPAFGLVLLAAAGTFLLTMGVRQTMGQIGRAHV